MKDNVKDEQYLEQRLPVQYQLRYHFTIPKYSKEMYLNVNEFSFSFLFQVTQQKQAKVAVINTRLNRWHSSNSAKTILINKRYSITIHQSRAQ